MNLTFGFSDSSPERALAKHNDLETALARLREWKQAPDSPIREIRHQPARPACCVPIPETADPRLRRALAGSGVEQLYTHQAEAFELVQSGHNVVVVTPTASGKTLCYNLPVLDRLLREPDARAMYLFPTKALAMDQLHEFQRLVETLDAPIRAFTYDGDTPRDARKAIRERANVVLTNPDMLHAGILPHHTRWAKCFERLRYFVLDELHYYRGIYGSHLANLLRRLKRICEFYGSEPQFICSSATIANPKQLAESLTEAPFELVERNGAPSGEKYFVFYNPPVVNRQLGIRRSYLHEARRLAIEFLDRGQQTLVFANNRLATEVLVTYLKNAASKLRLLPEAVRGYRGGYLPRERREIERGLREGRIRAVVSTNALELGMDIGSLDVSFTMDFDFQGNHDEVVADALFGSAAFSALLDLPGARPIGFSPNVVVAISEDCRTQARIAVEPRTSVYEIRQNKFKPDETISLYFTIRQFPDPNGRFDAARSFQNQCQIAEELMVDKIIPGFAKPLTDAIAQRRK